MEKNCPGQGLRNTNEMYCDHNARRKMYLRYQVMSSISKIYETHHDGNMKEMMKSPLTESTEIGLEGVEHFSPETGIVPCPANTADSWHCGRTQMYFKVLSWCQRGRFCPCVCLGCASAALSWSSIWILWQRVSINDSTVTCSSPHQCPWNQRVPQRNWGQNIWIFLYCLSPEPRGLSDSRAHLEARECWFWLPDTVPENSASCLVISLSDRLGKGPTPFHLQQLALRSQSWGRRLVWHPAPSVSLALLHVLYHAQH